ncbi:hypothetical protein VCRA2117O37_10374 [Vibrio crassostreae]|nr:hypothetical protein VCRA2114O423_10077 [Vibrio crassostreae]CAK1841879.1 hypothetical protein VCRA2113O413_10077 [Vibrio crassostreae]CAK1883861.1 hypothetical protein VCRA2117O37_10374 [Vibrio crassostreae]CAK2011290.1 hypothetical protein VCRA2118O429_20392 [Vibrio crassostreae]CAK2308083.1 hypothetical protein VCRA2113O410_10137 [Vibrio crassostreae]
MLFVADCSAFLAFDCSADLFDAVLFFEELDWAAFLLLSAFSGDEVKACPILVLIKLARLYHKSQTKKPDSKGKTFCYQAD